LRTIEDILGRDIRRWYIPLNGKVPLWDGWSTNPPITEDQIQTALGYGCNFGLRTGSRSGIVVVDQDKGGVWNGPPTLTIRTGSGGRHYYYKWAEGVRNSCRKLGPGLDVRGEGGQVVIPPGFKDHLYSVEIDLPLADCPAELLALSRPAGTDGAPVPDAARPPTLAIDWSAPLRGRAQAYADATPPAAEGTRNDSAFRLAGKIRALVDESGARLAEDDILDLVRGWNARCAPPLGDDEIVRCVESSRANGTPPADKPPRSGAGPFVGFVGTPPATPAKTHGAAKGVSSVSSVPPATFSEWPEPGALPDEKPPVAKFEFDFLPRKLQPWARDICERMQCPPDYLFVAIIISLAALLGRKIGIRPKRFDVWLIIANLWGAAVGRPGLLKTPAIEEVLVPLKSFEREAEDKYQEELKAFAAKAQIAAAKTKALKQELAQALKDGGTGEEIAKEIQSCQPEAPICKRIVVNDSTVEKLGEILNQNPNGVLSYRDELVGLLRSLEKEGQESARGFYLEAWNGKGSYTYDRIGRGTVRIRAAIVSILGSIQPGPLHLYLIAAAHSGKGDDGLLQRFQVVVWPDPSPKWVNHDREPDWAAEQDAFDVFELFQKISPDAVGAIKEETKVDPIHYLHFSEEAQAVFDSWREKLEHYLRSGVEGEAFESLIAKYRKLVPALALIFHLADGHTGSVGLESLERAIRASEYLKSHARRVYAVTRSPEMAAARELAKHLVAKDINKPQFTLGDVLRKGWSGLTTFDEVERAARVLVDLDWLWPLRDTKTGGRPRERYVINPRIYGRAPDPTDKTDETPAGEPRAEQSARERVPGVPDKTDESATGEDRADKRGPQAPDETDESPGEESSDDTKRDADGEWQEEL
jgi:putative DNA primase/helicase